ncbi:MAG: outer membrane beta-barrel protein [Gemmatimonadales bacterium]|nr:outer membrane beta-barrel protein [Gemmatimonadales bacterium]
MAQTSKELVVQVSGGGTHIVSDISPLGAYDTKMGAGFSGGVGLRLGQHFSFRADVAYGKGEIQLSGTSIGADLTRMNGSAIAQIDLTSKSFRPYVLIGGGLTMLNQHTGDDPKQTVGHVVSGLGVSYRLGGSGASIFGEGRLYVSQPRGLVGNSSNAARVLFDAGFGAGLSYTFPWK